MLASRHIRRLAPHSSVLFVCDIQEIFRKHIYEMPTVIHGTKSLVNFAREMKLPIITTEQYPSRFGQTVEELGLRQAFAANPDDPNHQLFEKMKFSMLTPQVKTHLEQVVKPKSVLLCGIEAHVCVLQTCLDLLQDGYDVHVVSDAVSSSTAFNRNMAIERMRQAGAVITSVESSIFEITQDATHPQFKAISQIVKDHLAVENAFDRLARGQT